MRPDPEARAIESVSRRQLLDAIRVLPLPSRQVITLALEGISNREIGDILGLTETTLPHV